MQTGSGASVLNAIGVSRERTKSYASWTVGNSMTSLEVLMRRMDIVGVKGCELEWVLIAALTSFSSFFFFLLFSDASHMEQEDATN